MGRVKDPVRHNNFISDLFARGRVVDEIIEKGNGRQYARILMFAKKRQMSSSALDSYVMQLRGAKRINFDDQGWVSATSIFQSRARDQELFYLTIQSDSNGIAIDEDGNVYLSEMHAVNVLMNDRQGLWREVSEYRAVIFVLFVMLGALALKIIS